MFILPIILTFLTKINGIPNSVNLGGHFLSLDDKDISNEIDDHYRLEDDSKKVSSNKIEKEMSEHIHADGSNMVKRLLKNYESYQSVLMEKEEENEKQEQLKNSAFMDHFHNAAGVVKDYGLQSKNNVKVEKETTEDLTHYSADDEMQTPKDLDNFDTKKEEGSDDKQDSIGTQAYDNTQDSSDIPDSLVSALDSFDYSATTTELPEQITPFQDYQVESTSPVNEEMDEESSSSYLTNSPYTSVAMQNSEGLQTYTTEDADSYSGDEDTTTEARNVGESKDGGEIKAEADDRDGRIVNKNGARRRTGGSGAIRISSGTSGSSLGSYNSEDIRSYINDDLPSFQPRPVFPAQTQFFPGSSGPMSQSVHNHIYDSEGAGIENGDEHGHVHLHVDGHQVDELAEDNIDQLFSENSEAVVTQDDSSSVLDWISNIFG